MKYSLIGPKIRWYNQGQSFAVTILFEIEIAIGVEIDCDPDFDCDLDNYIPSVIGDETSRNTFKK